VTLSRAARAELESLARSHRGRADKARRARIILLLSDGPSYSTICERVDCTPQTIATWKTRYEADGIIADNLSAHKTAKVMAFLAHPNVQLHYTPTYASWLNQVELWFAKVKRVPRVPRAQRATPREHTYRRTPGARNG
jgi:hypothetical protein